MNQPEFTQIPLGAPTIQEQARTRFGFVGNFNYKKLMAWGGIGLALLIVVLLILVFINRGAFKEERVKVSISGPEEISAGQDVQFSLRMENDNKVGLKDIKLNFFYPEKSIPLDEAGNVKQSRIETFSLEGLNPKEVREFSLRAVVVGEQGVVRKSRAELSYAPENIHSNFIKRTELISVIRSLPLQLTIVTPPNVFPNQRLTLFLDYRNNSSEALTDLRLRVSYPDGFKPDRFSPDPIDGKDVWDISSIQAGQGDRISIEGAISGQEREAKTFTASVEKKFGENYVEIYRSTNQLVVASSLLDLDISLDNQGTIVQAGNNLKYKLKFINQSRSAFSGLNLKVKLEGSAFDLSSLATDGFFDQSSRTISWTGAIVPELLTLPPGGNGEIGFSIKLKDSVLTGQATIRVSGNIETLTVPSGFSLNRITAKTELVSKIGSPIEFQTLAFYNDPEFPINSGPTPLKVGKETTFTIHWRIKSPLNDIERMVIMAFLPPGVIWKNKFQTPTNQELTYNPTTGQVIWRANLIPSGSGTSLPIVQVIFQVGITPSINQVGKNPALIGQSTFQGNDTLIGQTLNLVTESMNTGKISDLNFSTSEVQP